MATSAASNQSARSLLPSRSVRQMGKRFTGELPQFVCQFLAARRARGLIATTSVQAKCRPY
jgi:hypothetical protein